MSQDSSASGGERMHRTPGGMEASQNHGMLWDDPPGPTPCHSQGQLPKPSLPKSQVLSQVLRVWSKKEQIPVVSSSSIPFLAPKFSSDSPG